jgi:CheY-like chemotaxis protein
MNNSHGPILIVEDVPNVLELLEVTLRFKGYSVITARNGEEALEVMTRQRPILIVTDILMPKMDGYAFVQKLRLDPETRFSFGNVCDAGG